MRCLLCGTENPPDEAQCRRCEHKLLVLHSDGREGGEEFLGPAEAGLSLDEHLLERVSLLEEAVKRTAEAVGRLATVVTRLEQGLAAQAVTGEATRELLLAKGVAQAADWQAACERSGERQRAATDKRERFLEQRDRLVATAPRACGKRFVALLAEADEAYDDLDATRAGEALERALGLDPSNCELALLVAENAFNDGEDRRALELFEGVLAARPSDFEALLYSGVILQELGDLRRAAGRLRRAVARYPDRFLPQFALGAVLAAQGKLDLAIQHLERAVGLRPAPQAHFLLGSCLYESGHPARAIRHLREAVRRNPAFEEAHYVLGLACLDRGWPGRARSAFRAAQRLNPRRALPPAARARTAKGEVGSGVLAELRRAARPQALVADRRREKA